MPIETEIKKRCLSCKTVYTSTRFFSRDPQKKDGLRSYCKVCIRKSGYLYDQKNEARARENAKKHYNKNREKKNLQQKLVRDTIVIKIFQLLGGRCARCGYENKIALQIDHKRNNGAEHRKIRANNSVGYYRDILDTISDFQLLCANCNLIGAVENNLKTSIWKE